MSAVRNAVRPVVISGNSRRRPEEVTEFVEIYPDRCDRCGGEVKGYERSFDEHVVEDI